MFPLGSVTAPGTVLPLHVFEPRYVRLVERCLSSDGRFGVVLIERGSEVGGGDVRTSIGSFLRIVDARPSSDGRWGIVALATDRLEVLEWLDDDPHPWARVSALPDDDGADIDGSLVAAELAVRTWLARAHEVGLAVPDPSTPVDPDPVLASHQLSALSPLGPLDRQSLLALRSTEERLSTLVTLMGEQLELLEARFGPGS